MQFIQERGGDICKQKNYLEWVPVKFLILVSCLVEELQKIQEKTTIYQVTKRMNRHHDFPSIVQNLSSTGESIIFDKFAAVLFSFMVWISSETLLLYCFR